MQPQSIADKLSRITATDERNLARVAETIKALRHAPLEWKHDGLFYALDSAPFDKQNGNRAATAFDLSVVSSGGLIFRDRIQCWDGARVQVVDRESPVEAARRDLAHTVRVVTRNGPWVKDKPGTVSTFYSGAADGQVASTHATYLTMRTGSSLIANTGSGSIACYQNTGYEGYEGFFGWDTSSIGGDTVTDAAVSLYVQSGSVFGAGWTLEARDSNWGAALTTADWVAGENLGVLTTLASLAQGSISAAAYANLTSSGSNLINWINKTGTSYLLTCISTFVSGSTPASAEGVIMSSADTAGTTQDPKLVVTHASATKPFRRALLGVGF